MEHTIKSLSGFKIGATDGEIGNVTECYFDDKTWTVRYLIVHTGGWLMGRKVLIAPAALSAPDWENKIIPVKLTKAQVEASPDIDTAKTVSRQQEIELYEHYAWPYYGATGAEFYGGMVVPGILNYMPPVNEVKLGNKKKDVDLHLRSTHEVIGYQIHATDGEIGVVHDFIIDEKNWKIQFLVIETGSWFSGKKVIIAPTWITEVDWEKSMMHTDVSVDQIQNSPAYDPDIELQKDYAKKLHAHYKKK